METKQPSSNTKAFLADNFANIAIALSIIFLIFELYQNRQVMGGAGSCLWRHKPFNREQSFPWSRFHFLLTQK